MMIMMIIIMIIIILMRWNYNGFTDGLDVRTYFTNERTSRY